MSIFCNSTHCTPNLLQDQPLSDKNVIIGVFVFLVCGPLHLPCRRQRRENGRMVLAAVVEEKKRKEKRKGMIEPPFSIPFRFLKESPPFVWSNAFQFQVFSIPFWFVISDLVAKSSSFNQRDKSILLFGFAFIFQLFCFGLNELQW